MRLAPEVFPQSPIFIRGGTAKGVKINFRVAESQFPERSGNWKLTAIQVDWKKYSHNYLSLDEKIRGCFKDPIGHNKT